MIAVDTSALIAVIATESGAEACAQVLHNEPNLIISAGTLTETLVVAGRRGILRDMNALIDMLDFQTVAVTDATAARIGQIYAKWGKGIHPAGLNFGDCFAYDLAKEHSCPLLFVGNDFSRTDIESAI